MRLHVKLWRMVGALGGNEIGQIGPRHPCNKAKSPNSSEFSGKIQRLYLRLKLPACQAATGGIGCTDTFESQQRLVEASPYLRLYAFDPVVEPGLCVLFHVVLEPQYSGCRNRQTNELGRRGHSDRAAQIEVFGVAAVLSGYW